MRSIIQVVLAGCVTSVLLAAPPGATSSISGTVLGFGGKPVPGVVVSYFEEPSSSQASALLNGFVRTKPDGTFTISNVGAGKYQICVQAQEMGMLDPCVWSAKPAVTVAAGENSTGLRITLQKGAWLKLRLVDPNGFLPGNLNVKPGTQMVIAARTPSGFLQTTHLVGKDATGTNLEMLLPTAVPVHLGVFSQMFQCADANGTAVGAETAYTVTIPAGQEYYNATFTVTGRNQ